MEGKSFPNFWQSLGLLLMCAFMIVGIGLLVLMLKLELDQQVNLAVTYFLSMGLSVAIALRFKIRAEPDFRWNYSFVDSTNTSIILMGGLFMTFAMDPLSILIDIPENLKTAIQAMGDGSLLSFFAIVLFPAFLEEYLFRGVILDGLSKKMDARYAILISAVMFGAFHGNLLQGIGATIMGLYLGWIYIKTGSMLYPILLHGLNNGIGWWFLSQGYWGGSLIEFFPSTSIYIVSILGVTVFFILSIFQLNKRFNLGTAAKTI